jgi:hypothetical protein
VDFIKTNLKASLILLGGPLGDPLTRILFDYDATDGNPYHLDRSADHLPLPYRWILNDVDLRTVTYDSGCSRPNWSLRSDGESFEPRVENGQLKEDYLLLTRVRNFFDPDAFKNRRVVISLAGCHGLGTRAAPLLLEELARLHGWQVTAFDDFQVKVAVRMVRGEPELVPGTLEFIPLTISNKDYADAMDRFRAQLVGTGLAI